MANNDYICVYRQFFEEFANTSQIQDCMPIRVNPYNLTVDELVGEVMLSCVNYLIERKCPRSLVVPLTVIVVEEFINEAKKQPEEVSTPLELNKRLHYKISEVCSRYTDNEKLSNLPGPVKETYYSTHSTKHTRRRMEDRLICLPRFNTLHCIESSSEAGYYGIFDGHNGATAACYAVSHLHQFLAESEYYPDNPVQALHQAFQKTENKYNSKDENCGTAALVLLHQHSEKKLTVAWVGDSQAMLVSQDNYVMLVDPHKPQRTDERKRIEELGGCLINMHSIFRVNGLLAISRALGDKKLKPFISAEPEIRVLNLTGSEHFIVMGCDGLWDVVEPYQVIETVYFEVKNHEGQIDSVAKRLVDLAKENNSTDNISVIVIFLTDPAEIRNLSIDVTGHRPKIFHQDGVIMEANFQTNEKSPLGDPGLNGIYETNGNHFDIQNGSDEEFGPETNVDAVDDVLTPPKTLNPFSKETWQKTVEDNSDKLIEFTRQETKDFGNEFVKFSEELEESIKPVDDSNSNQLKSEKLPVDNVNPFALPPVDFSCKFIEDNNKYIDEINSRKEGVDPATSDFLDQPSDFKNEAKLLDESQDKNPSRTAEPEQTVSSTAVTANLKPFFTEEVTLKTEEDLEQVAAESPVQKQLVSPSSAESKNMESQPNEIHEFRDLIPETSKEVMDLKEQGVVANANGNPQELCSVIDIVEAARVSHNPCHMEDSENKKDGDKFDSELFSASAPVLDGEAKDEIIAESGGEIEDSEDDEWNYIKVESGSHQKISVDTKASDLILSSNEVSSSEIPTMNSPLNPEADEFIPVSAKTNEFEFNLNMTPKKAIPGDLADIIASSPNWSNMNNVSVPEEATFLKEIKSRPSNIFENIESPEQEGFDEKIIDLNNSLNSMAPESIAKKNEFASPFKEPQGIDFASDMTSSFIDPLTIGSELNVFEEKSDLMASAIQETVVEKNELFVNESAVVKETKEPCVAEMPSNIPDLLSPVSAHEDILPVDILKATDVGALAPPACETVSSNDIGSPLSSAAEKPADITQVIFPSSHEQPLSPLGMPSEILEKPSSEEKPTEAVLPKVPAAANPVDVETVVATFPGVVATKKDTKKPSLKTTSNSTAKTPMTSKPLVNGTKTSATAKKPTPIPASRASAPGKPVAATVVGSAPKTSVTKVSNTNKAQQKSTTSTTATSTLTKTSARPRPIPATSAAGKTSPSSKTTVTTSPIKSSTFAPKSMTKTLGSTPAPPLLKSRPRVPSAPAEKKTTSTPNGDAKTSVKRTEVITKKSNGPFTITTTTRVSSTARPATVPSKPGALKTTVTTTRTVTAKPRMTVSSTTASTTLSPASKASPTTRKSTIGADKQAKEVANRLTSKTGLASKAIGAVQGSTTATKTRKTLTTTTTTKTKINDKTETKAERILEVDIIRSENGVPLIENKTDINLINSIISDQAA